MKSEKPERTKHLILKKRDQRFLIFKNQKSFFRAFSIFLFLCCCFCAAMAQDSVSTKKKGHFILQPYLMFPTMDGSVGIGQLPATEIHANAGDIFSHLQIGAMLYAEYFNDRWAFSSDIIYMDLSQDIAGKKA